MKNYSVFLRAFEADDYILINKWRNDLDIQMYTGGQIKYVSSEMEKMWVQDKMMNNIKDIYLAICLNDDSKKMIGYISLNEIDYINSSAVIGGIIIGDREYRDGTSIFEAMNILLDYAYCQLNMHRVSGVCLVEHSFTPLLLKSYGFVLEGIKRDAVFKNGEYKNIEMYSLLREEYNIRNNEGGYAIISLIKAIRRLKKGVNN